MQNKIIKIEVGVIPTNCYVVVDHRKKAVLIDPGDDARKIMDILDKENASVEFILLTHGHFDHIGALNEFKDIPIYIHQDDFSLIKNDFKNLSNMLYHALNLDIADAIKVKDNDILPFGDRQFKVISTPGHTDGSCIYEFNDCMFSGDTLFQGSVGRCDLEGGDIKKMRGSIKKLTEMEKDYTLYPGHGEVTRLSIEKTSNPYLKNW